MSIWIQNAAVFGKIRRHELRQASDAHAGGIVETEVSLEGRDQNKLLRLLEKLVGCTDSQDTKAVINEAWEKVAEIENFVEGAGASRRPAPPDSDSDEVE